jgi:hypothetical protein
MYLYWFEQIILLRGSGYQRQNDHLPHFKRIENIAAQNLTAQPNGEILINQRGAAGPARTVTTKREESTQDEQ